MFTSSLPAIGSVVAFSVHKVETRDFPLLSAICSSVSPRIDSIRAIRSSGLPPFDISMDLHLGGEFLHILMADSFQCSGARLVEFHACCY